jgi:hypothetical protein
MTFLNGNKTYIVGALMLIIAGAAMVGITIPGFESIDAGQMLMEAFGLIFLRKGIASL